MFPNNKAWISVVDITPFFAVLSPNTPTAQIEQQVILAQTLDVKNELPKELIEDINNAILANPQLTYLRNFLKLLFTSTKEMFGLQT